MAVVIILLIIAGCAVYQFLKGSLTRAVASVCVALAASFIAFGYFEYLARLLGGLEAMSSLGAWAYTLCFSLLFIICFAILQTGIVYLLREPINLGDMAEKVGRPLCGVFLGMVVSGVVMVALALAPISPKFPYARFNERNPQPGQPQKCFLNVDGLVTGWFGMISKGSFSAIKTPHSFAVLHASFLDSLYLNRLKVSDKVPVMTNMEALDIPVKAAVWPAPDTLVDSEGQSPSIPSGHTAMIVRVGIRQRAIKDASPFTLSQLRILCKARGSGAAPLKGQADSIYPAGYMIGRNRFARKTLADKIEIKAENFGDQPVCMIDFVCYVPSGRVPMVAAFKLNNAALIPSPVSVEEAPAVIPFGDAESAPPAPAPAPTPAAEDSSTDGPTEENAQGGRRGLSDISRSVVGDLDP